MGVLRRLFGGGGTAPPLRTFEGDTEIHVVGESFYQPALDGICGGKCEDGHNVECMATLDPEPNNPHDANAVAVLIDGRQVGHLDRQTAAAMHREIVAAQRRWGQPVRVGAVIRGGWIRDGDDEGSYGVRLYVDTRALRLGS